MESSRESSLEICCDLCQEGHSAGQWHGEGGRQKEEWELVEATSLFMDEGYDGSGEDRQTEKQVGSKR